MTLDVSGSDANAYDIVTNVDSYWAAKNNSTWDDATTAQKEAAIIEATQYIDAKFREQFPGYIQSTSQRLEWPRVSATDRSGRTLTGIPQAVKDACAELALAALSARLVAVEERGGRIKSESVGPLSTTYMDGAPSGRTYEFAEMILASVLKSRGARLVRV